MVVTGEQGPVIFWDVFLERLHMPSRWLYTHTYRQNEVNMLSREAKVIGDGEGTE